MKLYHKIRKANEMRKQIQTNKGLMEGVKCDGYIVYKGVPYAKPPVGELRWRAPQELGSWESVYQADTFGKVTVQDFPDPGHPIMGRFSKEFYSNPEYIREMSEDCLYLNIWTPDDCEGKKLPVAFWLHGGGFAGGYSSEMEFDGEAYCKKGVILVSVEYRCNIFGFLAHPWLDAENERGISGNYGCLDQVAALKWVYENIENFGGDPKNITIFGQSAGSMSTQTLVSSDLTDGMIAKAIMQSGISCAVGVDIAPTLAEEEVFGEIFVGITGAKNIKELRALSTEELHSAHQHFNAKMWMEGKGLVLVPNADGYLLKDTVKNLWAQGKIRNIPYMAGVVNDDLLAKPEEVKEKRTGILMEECQRWSLKSEEINGTAAYLYYFSHDLPGDDWGAFHSSELWYTFGTLGRCWRPMTEVDDAISQEMVSGWTNFMKRGNPEGQGVIEWKPYTKATQFIKTFKGE